jgi:hypothetical protein
MFPEEAILSEERTTDEEKKKIIDGKLYIYMHDTNILYGHTIS